MTEVTELIQRWKSKNIKPLERPDDVIKVLNHYEFYIRTGKGSHEIIVGHEKLQDIDYNQMGIGKELTIPLKSGRKIKKYYIIKLMKYVELLEEFYGYK